MRSRGIAVAWAIAILFGSMLVSGSVPEAVAEEEGQAPRLSPGQAQKICPIMGNKILKSEYVDHEGKRIYFCCSGCKSTFLKDPGKYIKEMEAKGIVLDKVLCTKPVPDPANARCTE